LLTTIHIVGLEVYGYHGFFEEERSLGQKFVFDIEARLYRVETHRADELSASARYDTMAHMIVEFVTATKYRTLEALGEGVAHRLIEGFAPIETVSVRVSKSNAPVPHAFDSIGISVDVARAELKPAAADAI